MFGKALLVLTVVLAVVFGTGYLLATAVPQDADPVAGMSSGGPSNAASKPSVQHALDAVQPSQPEPPPENALGFMLARVADQYEQASRYPVWSVPLSPEQASAYRGNHYEPTTLRLPGDGQFTVTLEKFRFTRGDDILIAAAIKGPQVVGNRLEATLEAPDSRDAVASTSLQEAGSQGYFEGTLSADKAPGEYRLIVEATIDGRPVRHASSLSIEPYLGDFEGVGDPHISDNNLIIPVQFSAEESGFYSLSAQLYSGQQPIAQLQAEQRLDSTTGTINLRAHGTVLADRSLKGRLQLKALQLRQLPAKPGDRTNHAFGPEEGYSFTPPDLDGLTDTPAVNPESEQRAALLRQLADKF
ncbi:hypothetical protein RE428_12580 [Marinobacter nanhaiticus D15-8W]|uniref:Uncharacterized protein n=1 Tax=Marinobacter nanhaiticus D15-8W TaxID=626887 RepID=N6VYD5_9GAMM|nr:hypothetical protein [Marinobacter nanhaiticus]ENO12889.1 hypothetical protein J057_15865 [Marinobacter nanhaiticus D15-8W]BES70240.1 hypothetical protein RE428_12580 [Marinobacter nanhaiticus D15-8W]